VIPALAFAVAIRASPTAIREKNDSAQAFPSLVEPVADVDTSPNWTSVYKIPLAGVATAKQPDMLTDRTAKMMRCLRNRSFISIVVFHSERKTLDARHYLILTPDITGDFTKRPAEFSVRGVLFLAFLFKIVKLKMFRGFQYSSSHFD
jgi:hypothetical protein